MGDTVRFGISMNRKLLGKFDELIREESYTNRSEAIRDLIRKELVKREWKKGGGVAGGILLVYEHHHSNLSKRIIELQHKYHNLVISTQHIHLDRDNCMEIVIVKGKAGEINEFYNRIHAMKGIKQCEIIRATSGENI